MALCGSIQGLSHLVGGVEDPTPGTGPASGRRGDNEGGPTQQVWTTIGEITDHTCAPTQRDLDCSTDASCFVSRPSAITYM